MPGGGFVGGLIAATAFVLHAFAYGLKNTRKIIKIHPGFLMPLGLLISFCSAVAPVIVEDLPMMTGLWVSGTYPVIGKIGSALFFDTGVYFVVFGVALTIIFTISENA